MKVKELIKELIECDMEAEIGYEHCYIDYVTTNDLEPNYVETGGLHKDGYTRWVSCADFEPESYGVERYLIAFPNDEGGWHYFLDTNCPYGWNVLERNKALWLPIEEAPERVEKA